MEAAASVEVIESVRPFLAVAVALAAAAAILLLHGRDNLRDMATLCASVVMFLIVASMAPVVLAGGTVEYTMFQILPGADFAFRVDALGMVFASVSSFLWMAAAVYSIG
ncbi:MAG: monovalent cation/H+ antiporter subunit D family protein, partial [Alphaproteobacteria bacterium]|nr:monovalent cation/H+ antiporter subunit D family protein [Alphaproteobacteria bacterium]